MERSQALAELASHPLLAKLDESARAALEDAVRLVHYAPGELIVQQGEPADSLLLIAAGEVAILQDTRLTRLASAPCVLGVQSLLELGDRTASLEAITAVDLLELPRTTLMELIRSQQAFSDALLRYVGGELGRMYRRENAWLEHMADFFQSPNARIVPGPYEAGPYEMVLLVMQGDPAALGGLMPPGVRPLSGLEGVFVLTFNFFDSLATTNPLGQGRSFRYREAASFVPCRGPHGGPKVWCPELYPDNYLAITIGRELYGLPKRFGMVERRERRVDLLVDDQLAVRADWSGEEPCRIGDLSRTVVERTGGHRALAGLAGGITHAVHALGARLPDGRLPVALPVLVHRQVPAVQGEAREVWAVDQLREVPIRMSAVRSIHALSEPHVSCHHSAPFLRGRCLCAFSAQVGFELHRGVVVRDYLGDRGQRRRGLLHRLLGR